MTLVRSFRLPFHPDQKVRLNGTSQKNRVSVLLGVNGTQKSTVLRGLLEDALERAPEDRLTSGLPSCLTEWVSGRPTRVMAISSAATDRFPARANFGETGHMTRYDTTRYTYVGPRTGRNLVSRTQSVQALIAELLQLDSLPASVAKFIAGLSEKTTVPCKLKLEFTGRTFLGVKAQAGKPKLFRDHIARVTQVARQRRHPRLAEQMASVLDDATVHAEAAEIYSFIEKSGNRSILLDADLGKTTTLAQSSFSPRALYFALVIGLIKLGGLKLRDGSEGGASPDAFSAGQWGLFSSLATAALAARDRTLFLVDEPENALHPGWQRQYIADFLRAISHCKDCHVFMATHSPLLVSSLGSKDADLVGLRLAGGGSVSAGLMDVPVGWQTTDVLEDVFGLPSTRAPAFVEEVESAMALIAEGAAKNRAALQRIAKTLVPLLHTLPEDDVARQVISSIARISGVKP